MFFQSLCKHKQEISNGQEKCVVGYRKPCHLFKRDRRGHVIFSTGAESPTPFFAFVVVVRLVIFVFPFSGLEMFLCKKV